MARLPDKVQALADLGYAVIPASAAKMPLVKWSPWITERQTPGDRELLPVGDLYAILTGSLYNLVVLDFDGEAGVNLATSLKLAPNVITGSGGWHVWFPANAIGFPVKTTAGVRPGLDVRGEGGIVYLYGFSSKGEYRLQSADFINNGALINLQRLGLFPEKQVIEVDPSAFGHWDGDGHGTPTAMRVLQSDARKLADAQPGTRNATLCRVAYNIGGLVAGGTLDWQYAYDTLLAALETWSENPNDPGLLDYQMTQGAQAPWDAEPKPDAKTGRLLVPVSDLAPTHPREKSPEGPRAKTVPASVPSWQTDRQPVPYDALPATVSEFVARGWEVTACPPEFLAAAMFPALASAIGGLTTLGLRGGWRIPPSMYVGLVGNPSTAKTPALSRALRPVKDAEDSAWKNAQDGSPSTRYIVDDVTAEKLAMLLAENERGLLVVTDELKGFFGGMGQYKGDATGGRDRQFFLSAWSGDSITVDRVKRASLRVETPTLSVVGGIQPAVFDQLTVGEPDGMMERFLLVWGDPVADVWREDDMDANVIARYHALWNTVRDRYMQETSVPVTAEGMRAWKSWYDRFHATTPPDALAHMWNKVRTHVARIALILAACDGGSCDAGHIDAAVTITEWFLSHTMHVYRNSAASTPDERRHVKARARLAQFLEEWVAEHGSLPTRTEILQFGPPGSRKARDRDVLLDELGVVIV